MLYKMIRKIFLGCFLLGIAPALNTKIQAQTYTTKSKSCGNCGKTVSNNSRIGMRCPHCGVVWGRENERTSYSYGSNSYEYNSSGTVISTANLRNAPSAKSRIIARIPAYSTVKIISRNGAWYYVSVQVYADYNYTTYDGYIHSSLIN